MSEVRLSVRDTKKSIQGTIHGSLADSVVAALSAQPETIAELETALQRFIKPVDDRRPFASFHEGTNDQPWDAGIVIIDMAARIVAVQSSYSMPQNRGEVLYHDGEKATDVSVLYRVPEDWLFVYSLHEYESARDERIVQFTAALPLDVRRILYGSSMIEFIVRECHSERVPASLRGSVVLSEDSGSKRTASGGIMNTNVSDNATVSSIPDRFSINQQCDGDSPSDDRIGRIHAKWLMTPRTDLRGETPREVMLARRNFIDFDLHTREMQWSMLGEGPPPLARESFAYRFAGFGSHEYVLYYDLIRHLLNDCLRRVDTDETIDIAGEVSRMKRIEESWLNSPEPELDGRVPGEIIEHERRRIPMVMSVKSMLIDENCEWCQMLAGDAEEELGPAFWHLDGCNMDDGFEFSFHRTREEWEEEARQREEFNQQFEREWAEKHGERVAASSEVGPDA